MQLSAVLEHIRAIGEASEAPGHLLQALVAPGAGRLRGRRLEGSELCVVHLELPRLPH